MQTTVNGVLLILNFALHSVKTDFKAVWKLFPIRSLQKESEELEDAGHKFPS